MFASALNLPLVQQRNKSKLSCTVLIIIHQQCVFSQGGRLFKSRSLGEKGVVSTANSN